MIDFIPSDIYSFPGDMQGNYWWQHRHCHKPHLKRTQVIETSKEVVINDATGFTRYIVKLLSAINEDGLLGFQVQVVHHYLTPEGDDKNDLLLIIPGIDQYELDYHKIEHTFKVCVERYNSLVKAETKDFNDIDIYAKNIGYEKTHPKCCAFCKWSRMHKSHWHPHCDKGPMLECHDPKNQVKFQYMVDDPSFEMPHAHRYCDDGWQKLPWMECDPFKRHHHCEALEPIFPRVDVFGKCDNFEEDKH